ncbi:hypothetical protein MRB53_017813 [Persea americana]|uniref:Uncharacterized protein n=1 Tax=Persea americana TaxID=3435 RepID=A0ACC2M694_PERAE|nr:hypothetical protein MRB53_017813 [Persea americana]
MAAREKEVGHVNRKRVLSPSTPPKIDVFHRRTSISSWPGSPCRENPVLKEKSIPHYRLPTISSSKEVCVIGKRYEFKHLTLNTALPGSAKGKPQTPKLNWPKILKSLAYGKNQPVMKIKTPRKESSVMERREAAPTSPGTSRTSTTSIEFHMGEKQTTAPHMQEIKSEHDFERETVKEEVVKYCPLDILPPQDETLCDHEVLESCDSTAFLEEHEEARGHIISQHGEGETFHQEDEQGKQYDEECSEPRQDVKREQGEGGPEEDLRTKGNTPSSPYSSTIEKPHKLKFRQRKVMENKDAMEGTRLVQLKFKEKGDVEGVVELLIAELMEVVLRRQGIQGKKEVAAYNDVIEETVSKLLEKRKSKVKALVGAFETVISLQEWSSYLLLGLEEKVDSNVDNCSRDACIKLYEDGTPLKLKHIFGIGHCLMSVSSGRG